MRLFLFKARILDILLHHNVMIINHVFFKFKFVELLKQHIAHNIYLQRYNPCIIINKYALSPLNAQQFPGCIVPFEVFFSIISIIRICLIAYKKYLNGNTRRNSNT